ncbi:VOC family protein [Terriglobus sp.]|uniref:VOC family protein n=1 Tax=Terriglobus sp. TaxID=1889013 RepID=UPI003AFFCE6E
MILEFLVEDVDKEFTRVKEALGEFVQEPTAMPWGNRSFLFRDPDGNLVTTLPRSLQRRSRSSKAKQALCPSSRIDSKCTAVA